MTQEKSDNHALFSEKSERLAKALRINLDELPARMGVSKDMFYAYRTGRHSISAKAWRKLEAVEATVLPAMAVKRIEKSNTLINYGTRPLDDVLRPLKEDPEKLAAVLLQVAEYFHTWFIDTEALTGEYIERLERLASRQPLSDEHAEEFPSLQGEVSKRRAKLAFMRATAAKAIDSIIGRAGDSR